MRTPKNIVQHELIGMDCRIVSAANRFQAGLNGTVIDETMKTIMLRTAGGRKKIPKKGTVFRLQLGEKKVDVAGECILARPEDRIKKRVRKW